MPTKLLYTWELSQSPHAAWAITCKARIAFSVTPQRISLPMRLSEQAYGTGLFGIIVFGREKQLTDL
jgi:hypothetical protein